MVIINLREYFRCYEIDCFLEIPDEEVEAFLAGLTIKLADVYFREQRKENAYQRKKRRYKANYTLDSDEIENEVLDSPPEPFEIYIGKLECQEILDAIAALPEKQAKRIYSQYFLGMNRSEIARAEGVDVSSVRESIETGLIKIKNILTENF